MTLDQLRIFIAVAEHGHVTRAAEALGMSQSAASAAIATLEARYRTKLFDRVGRGIELTETGRLFLREARAVLDRATMARSVLQDLAGFATGTVGDRRQPDDRHLLAAAPARGLPRRQPGVRLNVVIRNTQEVETAVVEGEVNFGLVEGPTQHPALVRQRDRPGSPRAGGRLRPAAAAVSTRTAGSTCAPSPG